MPGHSTEWKLKERSFQNERDFTDTFYRWKDGVVQTREYVYKGGHLMSALNKNEALKIAERLIEQGVAALVRPRSWSGNNEKPIYFAVLVPPASIHKDTDPAKLTIRLGTKAEAEDYFEELAKNTAPPTPLAARLIDFSEGSAFGLSSYSLGVQGPTRVGSGLRTLGHGVNSFTLTELRQLRGIVRNEAGQRFRVRLAADSVDSLNHQLFNYEA